MTNTLTARRCVPCEGGTAPLTTAQEDMYLSAVPEWKIQRDQPVHTIQRLFTWKNFSQAIAHVNQVAELAESEGHHPDLRLYNFKYVEITLSTHAIAGLSENDFILAAKIDELAPPTAK